MKHLPEKLKSNRGATMLIALVFMLFCVFVGGSVLAAATANGARLQQSAQDEQDYLSARSAALVAAQQLYDTSKVTMSYDAATGGLPTVTCGSGNDLRSLALRCAAVQFAKNCTTEANAIIKVGSQTSTISITNDGASSADFEVTCSGSTVYAVMTSSSAYKITVNFYTDANCTDCVLNLTMKATETNHDAADANNQTLAFRWDTPTIGKGAGT